MSSRYVGEVAVCNIMKALAGNLYYIAPKNQPRNADVILKKAYEAIYKESKAVVADYRVVDLWYQHPPIRTCSECKRDGKSVAEAEVFCVGCTDNDFRNYVPVHEGIYQFIDRIMFAIPEFLDLNLSECEIANGVKFDDPNRAKFAITAPGLYLKEDHNFIDLTAFVQNVSHDLGWRRGKAGIPRDPISE